MAAILEAQSKYQKISIDSDPVHYGEHILYLDNMWQYSSAFEYRYHESLAILPAVCSGSLSRALVCGGGDGLAVRELMKFPHLEVDLVEIDQKMVDLYSNEYMLTRLNCRSLLQDRCKVNVKDATEFIKSCKEESYDLVILDFPSPGDGNREKNYVNLLSKENLLKYISLVRSNGVLISQTSLVAEDLVPYARLMLDKGYYIWNYDVFYTESTHDNFTVCSKSKLEKQRPIPPGCRMITDAHIKYGFSEATEITEADLEYYRLFQYAEGLDYETSHEVRFE